MFLLSKRLVCSLTLAFALSFASAVNAEDPIASAIPFKYAANHILVIPAVVGGKETSFVLDTGAGVNVISETLAAKLGCTPAGTVAGKRMSGQTMTMKLVNLSALQIGSCLQRNLPIAAWKLEDVFGGTPDLTQVEGLVSLEFFRKVPFTIDYAKKLIFIETDESLKKRLSEGVSVPIQITHKRAQTSITMLLWFSNGSYARVEVDTGSGALILDERYMRELGVFKDSMDVKKVEGIDETGHSYVRYFTKLPEDVFLAQSRLFTQKKPKVQFQKIIYDGLVGDGFLSNFTVTYDLAHKRLIFARF
ncbi:MAG: retropepsin-like aspartic protease [Candidatus Obscuribacterales bacterium]